MAHHLFVGFDSGFITVKCDLCGVHLSERCSGYRDFTDGALMVIRIVNQAFNQPCIHDPEPSSDTHRLNKLDKAWNAGSFREFIDIMGAA